MTAAKKGVATRARGDAKTTGGMQVGKVTPTRRATLSQTDAQRFKAVAADLRALRQRWLLWRFELPEGASSDAKPAKAPYYPMQGLRKRHGKQGSTADIAALGDFDTAVAKTLAEGFDGIGVAMLDDGFIALDFDRKDNTRDPLTDDEVLVLCPGAYIERSPSGRGLRAFYRGSMQNIFKGLRGIEVFCSVGFVTVTGNKILGSADTIAEMPEGLPATLLELAGVERRDEPRNYGPRRKPIGFSLGMAELALLALPHEWWDDYWNWLHVGMALHHEFGGSDDALELWRAVSRVSSRFEDGAFDHRWEGFGRRGLTFWFVIDELRKIDPVDTQSLVNIIASIEFGPYVSPAFDPDDDLKRFDLPKLPDDALYGVLREIVDAATADSEATRPGVAAAALAHFAARYGRALGFDVGDDRRTLAFYVLVVGPTGKGRKGTSSAFVRQLFGDLDTQMIGGWGEDLIGGCHVPPLNVLTGVSSGQGVIERVKDASTAITRNGHEVPVRGVEDKRLLLELSEFGSVFAQAAQESNTLSHVMRDAYDGVDLSSPTRSNPLFATKAHICVLGHITTSEFVRKTVGDKRSTEMHNGLLNRFAVMYSRRERILSRPKAVPDDVRRELVRKLGDNINSAFDRAHSDHRSRRSVVLKLTEGALALWDVEYPKLTTANYGSEIVTAMMARRETITLSVAALLAAMNGESAIGVEALTAALAWGEYIATSNGKVFATLAEARRAAELQADMQRVLAKVVAKGGSATMREMTQAFSGSIDRGRLEKAVEALIDAIPPQLVKVGETRLKVP